MNKKINEMFKNWGRKNQILPNENVLMKEKVLSNVPFSIEGYRASEKKKSLPWLSMTFATLAILVFIAGPSSVITTKNFSMMDSGNSIQMESPSVSNDGLEMMKMPRYYDTGLVSQTDNRQFLKINYDAEIKTRNISDMVTKIESTVRLFNGRIDGSSSGKEYGYVNFVVPASQFEIFKREVKDLTNDKLFIEQISSVNLLPEKQQIEKNQKEVEGYISSYKNEKAQLVKDHNSIVSSYNTRISGLDTESALLQNEWQTATTVRRSIITARLAQIQIEQNIIAGELSNENSIYQNKLVIINQKLKNAETGLQTVQEQDRNLIDNVSVVTGRISLTWVSLWEIADIFVPGALLAWILAIAAGLSYWRYRFLMQNYI
jgi:hypothetical protein